MFTASGVILWEISSGRYIEAKTATLFGRDSQKQFKFYVGKINHANAEKIVAHGQLKNPLDSFVGNY
ncbi:8564_t:CDS:2, partial [Funneliformis geosporum]